MKTESFLTLFKAQKGSKDIVKIVHLTACVSRYSRERVSKTDKEEKKLLIRVFFLIYLFIYFLFAHKNYSRSFITLRLNLWCQMEYFNDVLTTFLGLEQKALGFHQFVFQRWTKVLQVWNDMRVSN